MLSHKNIIFTTVNQAIIRNTYNGETCIELISNDGITTRVTDPISESLQVKLLYKFMVSENRRNMKEGN